MPVPAGVPELAAILVVEPLTEREREVLHHFSGMLNTAEFASGWYISVNVPAETLIDRMSASF